MDQNLASASPRFVYTPWWSSASLRVGLLSLENWLELPPLPRVHETQGTAMVPLIASWPAKHLAQRAAITPGGRLTQHPSSNLRLTNLSLAHTGTRHWVVLLVQANGKVHHLHVSEAMEMFQLQELVQPATTRSGSESLFIGARKQWRFQGSHGRIPVVAFGFWPCRCPAGPLRCLSRGYQKWTEAGTFHGGTRNVRCECNWVPLAGTLPLRSTMFEYVWTLWSWKAWK